VYVAVELLLLRLYFVFYYNFLLLKTELFAETAKSCGLRNNVLKRRKRVKLLALFLLATLPHHPRAGRDQAV
jgi:hypothetical protein